MYQNKDLFLVLVNDLLCGINPVEGKEKRLAEIEDQISKDGFWDNPDETDTDGSTVL
jgi:hypothetical protein